MRRRQRDPLPGETALPFDLDPAAPVEPAPAVAVGEMSTAGPALAVAPAPGLGSGSGRVVWGEAEVTDAPGVGGWVPGPAADRKPGARSGGAAGGGSAVGSRTVGPGPGGRRARPPSAAVEPTAGTESGSARPGDRAAAPDPRRRAATAGRRAAVARSESEAVDRWVLAQLARAPEPSAATLALIRDVLAPTPGADGVHPAA
jgi:hypothetical protein